MLAPLRRRASGVSRMVVIRPRSTNPHRSYSATPLAGWFPRFCTTIGGRLGVVQKRGNHWGKPSGGKLQDCIRLKC
ncbi:MAG: hypothetical protein JWN70_778 [Planctomycetaceae bacterium]|nr:hypothetical protein [Planctomycetaceae bacterium]